MIVFHVSGEHPELPLEEIRSVHEAYDAKFEVLSAEGQLILADSELEKKDLLRLAFTHEFYPTKELTDAKNLDSVLLGLKVKKPQTLCVRCLGFENNSAEERKAGEVLYSRWRAKVDFNKPELWVYIIKVGKNIAVSLEGCETDDFNKRDPNSRPFFHPLALNPKLARLFLNLARLKIGDIVLDPFCGSGSVVIEAALIGLKAVGSDKDPKMIWGCRKNLEFYNLKANILEGDATDIKLMARDGRKILADAIVTDPPYARSSKMFNKELGNLYDEFLKSAFKALKPGGHLVMAVPHTIKLGYPGFEKRGDYLNYVHKSLTRRIYILRKPN